jgi:hypothetical protein
MMAEFLPFCSSMRPDLSVFKKQVRAQNRLQNERAIRRRKPTMKLLVRRAHPPQFHWGGPPASPDRFFNTKAQRLQGTKNGLRGTATAGERRKETATAGETPALLCF